MCHVPIYLGPGVDGHGVCLHSLHSILKGIPPWSGVGGLIVALSKKQHGDCVKR